jgi:hypothetical protein
LKPGKRQVIVKDFGKPKSFLYIKDMITTIIIGVLGKYWGENYFHFTEEEMLDYGYLGCFFARIFGTGWLK